MKFHHIGIATEDIFSLIEKLKKVLEISKVSETVYDELQDANLCMITLKDGTMIELISGNMVSKLVMKRNYLYHTCFSTTNIEEELKRLISLGAMQISEIKEAKLFNQKRVVFLTWDLGIMELVEE